ncbi:MAG: carbon-nitrogen hydrolase family protein [Gemmataceae bacterium]
MTIPIACAQMACTTFDPRANLEKADHYLRQAARLGARLILFPEFLPTGCTYDKRLHEFAEPIGGNTTRWLARRSRQLGRWIAAGIVEEAHDGIFDTLLLTGPAGELFAYRKLFPAFFEQLYFHRGTTPGIFDTPIGRIGVMICWDMVHARIPRAMLGNIDLLIICSAWPDINRANIPLFGVRGWISRQPELRPQRLARQLGVPVAYCNMTGDFVTRVPGLVGVTYRSKFAGHSSIVDEVGTPLTALEREEALLFAEVSRPARRHSRVA